MAEVLLVSKPVAPPWNDSSKNLVRDLALALREHEPVVLARRGTSLPLSHGRIEPLYPRQSGGFAPGLRDNARVFNRLVTGRRSALWHFFFAPNPRSSRAADWAARLRRIRTVQTVCSAPSLDSEPDRVLFADRTVVLSRHTEQSLIDAGVDPARLRRIPPGIEPLAPLDDTERRRARRRLGLPEDAALMLYPGDLEFGSGAHIVLDAFMAEPPADTHLVMACRAKTPRARDVERHLREHCAHDRGKERVHWLGETSDIHALLGSVDLVLLPSETLYAKMDYPLVVLEAMSLARPVVVAKNTPAAEIAEQGAALAVDSDRDAVGEAAAGLLQDSERRTALGHEARRVLLERYTREPMARAYERLYDELVDGDRRAPPR